jgi:hypothetical protein
VRVDVVGFAATVSVALPLPVPVAGVTPIHATFDAAVQAQPAVAVTPTVAVPVALPIETAVCERP